MYAESSRPNPTASGNDDSGLRRHERRDERAGGEDILGHWKWHWSRQRYYKCKYDSETMYTNSLTFDASRHYSQQARGNFRPTSFIQDEVTVEQLNPCESTVRSEIVTAGDDKDASALR